MSKKLFVGGLAWATTDEGLRNAFSAFGTIIEAKVICDRETGRSRGFGFITFEEDSAADAAQAQMHGSTLDGRTIRIDSADNNRKDNNGSRRPRSDRPRRNDDCGTPRNEHADRYDSTPRNERYESTPRNDRFESAPRNERYDAPRNERPRRHEFSNDDFGFFPGEPTRGGRDNRRRDRKKERDMREDDERW